MLKIELEKDYVLENFRLMNSEKQIQEFSGVIRNNCYFNIGESVMLTLRVGNSEKIKVCVMSHEEIEENLIAENFVTAEGYWTKRASSEAINKRMTEVYKLQGHI